jgi:hypothetical protein
MLVLLHAAHEDVETKANEVTGENMKNVLIEPGMSQPRGERYKEEKLREVRVLYLFNNYASKAICRHETFSEHFFFSLHSFSLTAILLFNYTSFAFWELFLFPCSRQRGGGKF